MNRRIELVESPEVLNRQMAEKQDCSIADAAEAAALREAIVRATSIARQHKQTIVEKDYALTRVERGQCGVCEKKGEPLPYERLRLTPKARIGLKNSRRSTR